MKRNYADKVVVITGGSSGIGLALAKEFAQQHAQLVLIARDETKLADAVNKLPQSTSNSVITYAADVADKPAITSAIESIGTRFGKIDVLINCAGTMRCGRFKDMQVDEFEKCLSVNYLGAVYASKAAWKYLKATKGQLSFISSVAGYVGLIGYSSYAPTKFALTGLVECLRLEAKDDDIQVSILYPPDTDTPLLQYEFDNTLPECRALSKNIKTKTAAFVAKHYVNALQKNKLEVYCDADSRLVRLFKNNFPGFFRWYTDRVVTRHRQRRKELDKTKR